MLVLTRRIGEVICIGSDITAIVVGMNGNQVKIAIEAPKSVPVHRSEIQSRVIAEFGELVPGDEIQRGANGSSFERVGTHGAA